MKAIRVHGYGSPEVMQLEDVPGLTPGPGEVVVKVHAAGVNPVDTYIRSGPYRGETAFPYTPGLDGAGARPSCGANSGQPPRGDAATRGPAHARPAGAERRRR